MKKLVFLAAILATSCSQAEVSVFPDGLSHAEKLYYCSIVIEHVFEVSGGPDTEEDQIVIDTMGRHYRYAFFVETKREDFSVKDRAKMHVEMKNHLYSVFEHFMREDDERGAYMFGEKITYSCSQLLSEEQRQDLIYDLATKIGLL